ncbi:MAG: alpha/beta fold hydrolase [Phycisphaerales bacterium]|jgi:alpha-beta hydrolase superfamily lysophospholipase|nr:alpha/beta fold hydrolase [Phycisphaerales bacterium]
MGRRIKTLVYPITTFMLAVSSGCSTDFYARRLVKHNTSKGKTAIWWLGSADKLLARGKISSHHRIPAADGIELDVWVINARGKNTESLPPSRGTVMILHGILDSKARFFGMAQEMANMGYNVVMLDHRAHGRSEGIYTTFGAKEKFDARDVLDSLLNTGAITEPIYVCGQSMGAAISIQYAAIDPRCKAVMAIAPYTDMRDAARRFVPFMNAAKFEEVVKRGGELADFNPDDASTIIAARQLKIPLLVIHGRIDAVVPHAHGRAVYEAADVPKKLVSFPMLGHVSLMLGRQKWFAKNADQLFSSVEAEQQNERPKPAI